MSTIQEVSRFLQEFAPSRLAEEWDNVGHLVGDAADQVSRLMTCLTITPGTVAEAVEKRAELIVTHHPFPFRPLKRVTTETVVGRLLLRMISAGIGVYSPHTAFDSAALGINQQLAERLGLWHIQPLIPETSDPRPLGAEPLGAGRWGRLPHDLPLIQLAELVKLQLGVDGLQLVGPPAGRVSTVAVACGSAGSFLEPAIAVGCHVLLTGETSFHTCLEAEASQMSLLLPGHFASERFAVEQLAEVLAERFPQIHVWSSRREADPLRSV